jgi:hypothetical protein
MVYLQYHCRVIATKRRGYLNPEWAEKVRIIPQLKFPDNGVRGCDVPLI